MPASGFLPDPVSSIYKLPGVYYNFSWRVIMADAKKPEEAVLVTGGAGYIGSHVVRDLGEAGYFPVVVDNLSTGNRQHVLFGEFIEGEIQDTELITDLIGKYNIKSVLHFAASIVVEESVQDPLKYYRNNSLNSYKLIKNCLANKIENFVFSSTAAVYGIPEKSPIDESATLKPINPYGKSKLFTEMLLGDVALAYPDFNYIALRYFNVAGADRGGRIGQKYQKPTHLITRALKTALGEYEKLCVFGTDYDTPDGTAVRDYIHIDDLANAHLLALNYLKERRGNGIFNCGYGTGYSVAQVVESVKRVTGNDFPVESTERRAGDPPALIADSSLIRKKIDWQPHCNDLDLIIRNAYEWEKTLLKEKDL